MDRPSRRPGVPVIAALTMTALVAAGGCSARGAGAEGAGPDVDVCDGYRAYDGLREPRTDRPDEVLRYAEATRRVVARIRVDYPIHDRNDERVDVPASVGQDVATIRSAITELVDAVRRADGDVPATRRAVDRLATGTAFNRADADLADFVAATCRR